MRQSHPGSLAGSRKEDTGTALLSVLVSVVKLRRRETGEGGGLSESVLKEWEEFGSSVLEW